MNTYGDLQMVSDDAGVDCTDVTTVAGRLALRQLEQASRDVELFCHRSFYPRIAVEQTDDPRFTPINQQWLGERMQLITPMKYPEYPISDLVTATDVRFDSNGDYTYAQDLTFQRDYELRNHDVQLRPGNHSRYDPPFDMLMLLFPVDLTIVPYLPRARTCQVTGTWGYWDASWTQPVTAAVSFSTDTTPTMVSDVPADLAVGQTLLVGSEYVYLRGGSGTAWTCDRGVNGSTAAAHVTPVAPLRVIHHPTVVAAALEQANHLRHMGRVDRLVIEPDDSSHFRAWSDLLTKDVCARLQGLVRSVA